MISLKKKNSPCAGSEFLDGSLKKEIIKKLTLFQ